MTLEIIFDSFLNGQKKQAVTQIKQYRVRRFFTDYPQYLEDRFSLPSSYQFLKEAIQAIHREK